MTDRKRGLSTWVATCGPVGYTPIAPGSAGALVGLVLFLGVDSLPLTGNRLLAAQTIAILAVGIVGLWSSRGAIRNFNHMDPSPVVIDEVFGQLVTFWGISNPGWQGLLIGFILFRVMDIFKPFPARRAEKLSGGWGIMLDDGVAGLYSLAMLVIIRALVV